MTSDLAASGKLRPHTRGGGSILISVSRVTEVKTMTWASKVQSPLSCGRLLRLFCYIMCSTTKYLPRNLNEVHITYYWITDNKLEVDFLMTDNQGL